MSALYCNVLYCTLSVPSVDAAGHDIRRDSRRQADVVVRLPGGVGPRLRPPTRPSLPSRPARLVRPLQVRLRVAAGRPRSSHQGPR